jgi:virginiamycin A acetyltransferase
MRVSVRDTAKAVARGMAHVAVSPFVVSFAIRARIFDPDRALMASTQMLAMIPGFAGQYLRRAFLHHTIAECHPSVVVEWGTTVSRTGARLGRNVYVGPGCHLGLVEIAEDALIAAGVHLPSGGSTHGIDDVTIPIRDQQGDERCVRIGAGSWIGSGCIVMADVGAATVVGAGSVVTRALPAFVVATGAPAQVRRHRRPEPIAV